MGDTNSWSIDDSISAYVQFTVYQAQFQLL